jgi:hypothetical protein
VRCHGHKARFELGELALAPQGQAHFLFGIAPFGDVGQKVERGGFFLPLEGDAGHLDPAHGAVLVQDAKLVAVVNDLTTKTAQMVLYDTGTVTRVNEVDKRSGLGGLDIVAHEGQASPVAIFDLFAGRDQNAFADVLDHRPVHVVGLGAGALSMCPQ